MTERTNERANEVIAWYSWHTHRSMFQQIRDSISAPKVGKSAPSTAPITETAAAQESTALVNGPDLLGGSEQPLFEREPTHLIF
ncbi:hypothetical protein CWB59_20855 [Pseudoalteromonas sp. S326]|uniref:hypothetical protein n=1 Tax=Pseudoalteromonas sp. S326 TaxID=579533 RepID=UPI00110A97E2|nr:hypothetical protein [Pseudoalteromonas sp. S326]TMO12780.1 hypothetical protein CWB59_20855 [Pseudoalteromonas sp. S326]